MLFGGHRIGSIEAQLRETRDIAVEARTEGRNHSANCVEHNRRVEDMLTELREERMRQHTEGQEATERIHERISKLSGRMNMLLIGGLGTTVLALFGALYAIFSHKLGLTG